MPRYSTAFGMDVHLRSTTVCALDAETGEAVARRFRGSPWGEVAEWMHGRKGSERLLRRREEMLERGMPQAKANAATAAELVRWLWALGMMCREAGE